MIHEQRTVCNWGRYYAAHEVETFIECPDGLPRFFWWQVCPPTTDLDLAQIRSEAFPNSEIYLQSGFDASSDAAPPFGCLIVVEVSGSYRERYLATIREKKALPWAIELPYGEVTYLVWAAPPGVLTGSIDIRYEDGSDNLAIRFADNECPVPKIFLPSAAPVGSGLHWVDRYGPCDVCSPEILPNWFMAMMQTDLLEAMPLYLPVVEE
jgi:hypothetical protein